MIPPNDLEAVKLMLVEALTGATIRGDCVTIPSNPGGLIGFVSPGDRYSVAVLDGDKLATTVMEHFAAKAPAPTVWVVVDGYHTSWSYCASREAAEAWAASIRRQEPDEVFEVWDYPLKDAPEPADRPHDGGDA